MRMDGLARLHASMQQVGIERMRFRVRHGPLTFDGLFLADTTPYELALGALGHPDIALVFDVRQDYTIKPYLGDAYGPLAAALNLGAGTGQPLMPSDFAARSGRRPAGHRHPPRCRHPGRRGPRLPRRRRRPQGALLRLARQHSPRRPGPPGQPCQDPPVLRPGRARPVRPSQPQLVLDQRRPPGTDLLPARGVIAARRHSGATP